MTVGSPAPSFELRDQDRNLVSLDSFKGSKTLVVFIPFPFTGICDGETCAIRDNLTSLNELDAKVVIVTVHAVPVAKKWADENGFTFLRYAEVPRDPWGNDYVYLPPDSEGGKPRVVCLGADGELGGEG